MCASKLCPSGEGPRYGGVLTGVPRTFLRTTTSASSVVKRSLPLTRLCSCRLRWGSTLGLSVSGQGHAALGGLLGDGVWQPSCCSRDRKERAEMTPRGTYNEAEGGERLPPTIERPQGSEGTSQHEPLCVERHPPPFDTTFG